MCDKDYTQYYKIKPIKQHKIQFSLLGPPLDAAKSAAFVSEVQQMYTKLKKTVQQQQQCSIMKRKKNLIK